MPTVRYTGNATPVYDTWTFTVGSNTAGHTFIITINGKSITYTATASDSTTTLVATNATTALANNSGAGNVPEFKEYSWTSSGAVITATARTIGAPPPGTFVTTGSTGTFTASNTIAGTGPSDWGNNNNFTATPANSDTIIIEDISHDILWNLDGRSSLTGLTLIHRNCKGKVGLPPVNSAGYNEPRATHLKVKVVALTIDSPGCTRFLMDNQTIDLTAYIYNLGSPDIANHGAFILKNGGTNTAAYIYAAYADIAPFSGETSSLKNAYLLHQDSKLKCSSGVTLTNIYGTNGNIVEINSATTLIQLADQFKSCTIRGSGTQTSIKAFKGTVSYQASGTVTTLQLDDATWDERQNGSTHAITNAVTCTAKSKIFDPIKRITGTFQTQMQGPGNLTIDRGNDQLITWA